MGSAASAAAGPTIGHTGSASRRRAMPHPILIGRVHSSTMSLYASDCSGGVTAVRKLMQQERGRFVGHTKPVIDFAFVRCGASAPRAAVWHRPPRAGEEVVNVLTRDGPAEVPASSPVMHQAEPPTARELCCFPHPVHPSRSEDLLVTGSMDGHVRVWDTADQVGIVDFEPFGYPTSIVGFAGWSPNVTPFAPSVDSPSESAAALAYTGRFVVVSAAGDLKAFAVTRRRGAVTVDVASSSVVTHGSWVAAIDPIALRRSWYRVGVALAVKDGQATSVVAASDGVSIARTDCETLDTAHHGFLSLPQCRNGIHSVAVSTTNARLGFAAGYNLVVAVDIDAVAALRSFRSGFDTILTAIAVSDDGQRVVAGTANGSVAVWAAYSGPDPATCTLTELESLPKCHSASVEGLSFVADDRAVAVTGTDPEVTLVLLPRLPRHALPLVIPAAVLSADVVQGAIAPFLAACTPKVS